MVTSINCFHVATPQRLRQAQKPRSSPSKALTGFLSSINLSFRGFLLDGKIFYSISVRLIKSSVGTTSKRSMGKDKETAAVTEHIIPIP